MRQNVRKLVAKVSMAMIDMAFFSWCKKKPPQVAAVAYYKSR